MGSDIQAWVRETAAVRLPVQDVAKRVALMANEITALGDPSLQDVSLRPIGIDYAILALPNDLHAALTPEGERLLLDAYKYCKETLKPYLIQTDTEIEWDDVFAPYTAADWVEGLVSSWREDCALALGPVEYSPAGSAIDFMVSKSDSSGESPLSLQISYDAELGIWVLAVLDPTRGQRKALREMAWEEKGNVLYSSFASSSALASAAIGTIDKLISPELGDNFRVVLAGIDGDDGNPEWEMFTVPGVHLSINVEDANSNNPTPWPGTDLSLISEILAPEDMRYLVEAFDIYGELRSPIRVAIEYSHVRGLRQAGFIVVEDADELGLNDEDDLGEVTVYPKTTRAMVV